MVYQPARYLSCSKSIHFLVSCVVQILVWGRHVIRVAPSAGVTLVVSIRNLREISACDSVVWCVKTQPIGSRTACGFSLSGVIVNMVLFGLRNVCQPFLGTGLGHTIVAAATHSKDASNSCKSTRQCSSLEGSSNRLDQTTSSYNIKSGPIVSAHMESHKSTLRVSNQRKGGDSFRFCKVDNQVGKFVQVSVLIGIDKDEVICEVCNGKSVSVGAVSVDKNDLSTSKFGR